MEVKYDGKTLNLPDFLIVGTARAGTTFLYQTLCNHPGIFMPWKKEPMFFYSWGKPLQSTYNPKLTKVLWIINNLENYLNLFHSAKTNQLQGEASTWYLAEYDTVIPNIKKLYGNSFNQLKIIMVLRNPVNRAWSHYLKTYSENREFLDFEDAISPETMKKRKMSNIVPSYQYIDAGMYFEQTKAYLDNFKDVKIFIFEEEFNNQNKFIKKICKFLGLEYIDNMEIKNKVNSSGKPKNKLAKRANDFLFSNSSIISIIKKFIPKKQREKIKLKIKGWLHKKYDMPEVFKKKLTKLYKSDIEQLEKLLNRNLNIWK